VSLFSLLFATRNLFRNERAKLQNTFTFLPWVHHAIMPIMVDFARRLATQFALSLIFGFVAACGSSPKPPNDASTESARDPASAEITGVSMNPDALSMISRNTVCGDLASPCPDSPLHAFEPHELTFRAEVQARREALDSRPFFALVLDTRPAVSDGGNAADETPPKSPCGGFFDENERLAAQTVFPQRKVFASRHGCSSSVLSYAGGDKKENVLAVYAGANEAEARETLRLAWKRFPKARIVRMQIELLTFN